MSYVDRRIGDAEHVLCDDVQQFTAGLADLTGELTVAAVDALFYGTALRVHRGTHGYLAAMAAYIVSAGTLTAALAPNFSRLVSKTQELESRYKASQARFLSSCVGMYVMRRSGIVQYARGQGQPGRFQS